MSNNSGGYARSAYIPPKINRPKIRLRVSYTLQSSLAQSQRHCFGINSLAQDHTEGWLYSAGRDSTIRCWDTNSVPLPSHLNCFEHHTDWVNDIFLCNNYKTLVSCSSDASIKIWDTESSNCTRTLSRHGDYVKAISYAPEANIFASAGLDSNIFIWDINQCLVPVVTLSDNGNGAPAIMNSSSGFRSNVSPIVRTGCDKGSIYSLGINAAGTLVMTGSTETLVRGWDPRTGQKVFKLKGHGDNIKALIMNAEGTLCLTGSSDFTIRLWDIGQQRCVHVFEVHDDSIWSLATDPSFGHVFSGSRDGSVFATDLSTSKSVLLFTETHPVLKILHSHHKGESLWVTTTDSSIKKWPIEGMEGVHAKQRKSYAPPAILSSSPTTTVLQGPRSHPLVPAPATTIPGRPGMVKHHILNNRRHVVTKDSSGGVELWDVTKGEQIDCCSGKSEQVSFEDKCEELTEMVSLPNWFSVDTKTGSLSVHMDFPQCFSAEVYAIDAGLDVPPDEELQINLGERVLRALFTRWLEGHKGLEAKQISSDKQQDKDKYNTHHNSSSSDEHPPSSDDKHSSAKQTEGRSKDKGEDKEKEPDKEKSSFSIGKSGSLKKSEKVPPASTHSHSASNGSSSSTNEDSAHSNLTDKQKPLPQFIMPPNISITISEEGTGATMHRSLLCQLDGSEPSEVIPQWILDCLLHGNYMSRETPKIGFYLITADESQCPPLPQGTNRVSAHKLLKIRKVATHVVNKLSLELPTKLKPYITTPISNESVDEDTNGNTNGSSKSDSNNTGNKNDKVSPENYIEILCNSKVLPPNIDLATARAFFWKSGDDLVLNYRINQVYLDLNDTKNKNAKGGSIKKSKIPKLYKSALLTKSRG